MKIGFVGLGNMGTPMAVNLTNAGHEVVGFDPVAAIPEGVTKAQTAQEAASGADVVITMLPNGDIAHSVASDILPVMTKGCRAVGLFYYRCSLGAGHGSVGPRPWHRLSRRARIRRSWWRFGRNTHLHGRWLR